MLALRSDHLSGPDLAARPVRGAADAAGCTVRLLDPAALTPAELACWDRLAGTAGTANPFAQPWLQRLSIEHCDHGQQCRLAVVENDHGGWLGTIALVRCKSGPLRVRVWASWTHPNQFTGTPLVAEADAPTFWRALLGWLDRQDAIALRLINLPLADPANRALAELCQATGRRYHEDRRCRRAMLDSGDAAELAPKLRRRIEGLERKLEREHGPLSFEVTRDPRRIAALIEPFLTLEASGWKGRAGSALAARADTLGFFREVALAASRQGGFELAVLNCGGRALAMSTQLVCGDMLHGFKSAYDEAFASHAPGLLLLARMTRHWQAQGDLRVDSCARPGQQPVSKLWPGGLDIGDCRIALGGPWRRARFAALLGTEAVWHALKGKIAQPRNTDKA